MDQTDRQTDKSTHWKTAVFDTNGNWEALEKLPDHVKEVHKKLEICPTTGKEHYQIHVVCHRQVRLSAMTGWIKHTKWFMVIGKQHIANSIAYISKLDTTAPGAEVQVVKGEQYYQIHDLLLIVARCFELSTAADMTDLQSSDFVINKQYLWKYAAASTVRQLGLKWITKLSNPVLEKSWNIHHATLLEAVYEDEGSFIIEEPRLGDFQIED